MKEPADFSLVLGGPLYQLWRRTRLSDDALQGLRRRIFVLTAIAWVPLLVLAIANGHAWGGVALPFLNDIELHVRSLIAIPLLIAAELIVHRRTRSVVAQFEERGLVPDAARPAFDAAINAAMRLRNSIPAEVILIVLVYVVGWGFVWHKQVGLDAASWRGAPVNGTLRLSLAGWWLAVVSLPLFQFLWLRWYFRLFIWAQFLWRVSRLPLNIMPTHPDRCGGLGFLGSVVYAFGPLLFAQGVVLAGMMANRIFYAGATLLDFKLEIIGIVALMVFAVLAPLLVFSVELDAAKHTALREYGALAQRYVREYDRKWLRGGAPANEPFIGSADIQSLADLGNSFDALKSMRLVPFTLSTLLELAVITLLPALPLTLTMLSADEVLNRLFELVF